MGQGETRALGAKPEGRLINQTKGPFLSANLDSLGKLASLAEAEDMIKDASDESVRDAVLIAAAQRGEHYEIAAYGAVRHFAQILRATAQAQILDWTIKEEGHADHLLTEIANRVNPYAEKAARPKPGTAVPEPGSR